VLISMLEDWMKRLEWAVRNGAEHYNNQTKRREIGLCLIEKKSLHELFDRL
jgi:hypothetical protein